MASLTMWKFSMTPQDKSFYKALGQRIAEARKTQGFTQVELSNQLGISQQTTKVAAYALPLRHWWPFLKC